MFQFYFLTFFQLSMVILKFITCDNIPLLCLCSAPLPPTNVSQVRSTTTTTSATVKWTYPRDLFYADTFLLAYHDAANTLSRRHEVAAMLESEFTFELESLTPGQNYTLSVTSQVTSEVGQGQRSIPAEVTVTASRFLFVSLSACLPACLCNNLLAS